ncbi:MAG: hypothetical protein D6690_00600 [Nitrospirae bacterium]|nr:MAG: hypothetical protein D6690_00600 [Nitrospirota bacterium]
MSGMILISRTYRFSAAHRLHTDRLPDDVNRKIYGKCNNPNGHGHNYTVVVTIRSDAHGDQDIADRARALDDLVQRCVVERFDHRHLNYDPAFRERATTGENLARLIWELLVDQVPFGQLAKIGVVETRDNFFEYCGTPSGQGASRDRDSMPVSAI